MKPNQKTVSVSAEQFKKTATRVSAVSIAGNLVLCIFKLLAGLLASSALFLCIGRSAIGNVLLIGLLVSAMYGANLMLTGMLPAYFLAVIDRLDDVRMHLSSGQTRPPVV